MPSSSKIICKPVFYASSGIILILVMAGTLNSEGLANLFSNIQASIVERFTWLYVLAMTGFLLFAVYLLFSSYGNIRLGDDTEKPEFSYLSWLSMLFSAGMGIGLLFYGVAEPLYHYQDPVWAEPGTPEAAGEAMSISFLHWGFHPWACYAVIGLILAYFGFRKKLPFSLRSAFYPLLGDRIYGFWGHLIDTLAIVSTLFGVATSLGLGAMQINSGLEYKFGLNNETSNQLIIIAVITLAATVSVVTGLKGGIRRLSEANMLIGAGLLLFVFFAGSTWQLLNAFTQNLGAYLQILPRNSLWTASYLEDKSGWLGGWTVFYWAWWIAWSPFVGMFIARISKGRTIREFLTGVLLVPCLLGFMWLTVFGNSALELALEDKGALLAAVNADVSSSLFVFLENFPFTSVIGAAATICIALFFVTSSDSASLVIDTIASGGRSRPDYRLKIYWAVLEGLIACILLYVGSLKALQTASITTALPFTIVLIIMMFSFMKALRQETDSR